MTSNGSAISGGFGDSQSDMIIACYAFEFLCASIPVMEKRRQDSFW